MADLYLARSLLALRPQSTENRDATAGGARRRFRTRVQGVAVGTAVTHQQPIVIDVRHLRWQVDAACRGADRELFFDEDGPVEPLQELCNTCPVRIECLDYANENKLVGFWGGMTDAQRRKDRRARRRAKSAPTT